MPSPLETLAKILKLEQEQGYRNTAVTGGLDKLAGRWQSEARRQMTSPEEQSLINDLIAQLTRYPTLDSREARIEVIQGLLSRLSHQVSPATRPTNSGRLSPPAPSLIRPNSLDSAPNQPSSTQPPLEGFAGVPEAANVERDSPRPPEAPPDRAGTGQNTGGVELGSSAGSLPPLVSKTNPAPPARPKRAPKGAEQDSPPAESSGARTVSPARRTTSRPPAAPIASIPIRPMGDELDPAVTHIVPMRRTVPRPPPPAEPGAGSGATQLGLNAPIAALRGVGPKQTEHFRKLGIRIIRDLLFLFPRRYDDYSRLKPISRLELGEEVTVIGTIWETHVRQARGGMTITHTIVSDGTGTIQATWFNQPYLADRLQQGAQIVMSGKVDAYLGHLTFNSPEWEPLEKEMLHTARMVPVYPLTQGITAKWLRAKIKQTVDYWAPRFPDYLPAELRHRLHLVDLSTALSQIHFPDTWDSLAEARRRLDFDELLLLQLGLLQQRRAWQSVPAVALTVSDAWLADWLRRLPFTLTGAQQRALADIRADLARTVPMNRLLEGDVGSGKTIVAAAAMSMAVANRAQAALMAPTEILAEQHYRSLSQLLGISNNDQRTEAPLFNLPSMPAAFTPRLALLTGSTPESRKAEIRAGLKSGLIHLVVGTHALIQRHIEFQNLGVVVIDEQHRFGVEQRAQLRQKGHNPHVLVMTATPIPRTLALTIHGDLDLSILDEMPPGRTPIQTRVLTPAERERAYAFIRRQIEKGRQAFIIYPLVEESDKSEAKAAVDEYQRLQSQIFADLKLGLLHGRMKAEEKETVMSRFKAGELHILVATSVIEVGIDVPNATVMFIEGANHFGLAQLHQFRGRVGRGPYPSYCLLLTDAGEKFGSAPGEERLQALESTTDGFKLAEIDLDLRGPGQFLGTRQSGLPETRLSSLTNTRLIALAQMEARQLFEVDPNLTLPENQALGRQVAAFWKMHQGGDVS